METESTIEALIDTGVFNPTADEAGYGIAPSFEEAVEARREELTALDADMLETRVRAVLNGGVAALVASVGADDQEFAAICLTLADRLDAEDDVARVASVVQQYRRGVPRSEGSPGPFLAVHGDVLGTLTRLYERSIVYIWREDCEPCDTMRETLETQLSPDSDVALFAVYGPEYARTLVESFDVVGGPTTLFVREGRVKSRLQGAQHPESVASELRLLSGEG